MNNGEKTLAMQVAGWMIAELCSLTDKGIDIRKVEVPELMHRMGEAFPSLDLKQ